MPVDSVSPPHSIAAVAQRGLRGLHRADARLCLAVRSFVREDLGIDLAEARVLVALSGGVDSTALLVMLAAMRDFLRLELAAAHLDHGLRPESEAEARAAAALCAELDVPFLTMRQDVAALAKEWHTGLEDAGRRARYAFLEEARREAGAQWIATAHHADDLAEDILLRLIRGAQWPGLGGMRGLRGRIMRPLLMVDKARLVELLRRNAIPWQEDGTNQSRNFRRNRVRLDILPLILRENPDFLDAARNLWRGARLDEAFWQERLTGIARAVRLADGENDTEPLPAGEYGSQNQERFLTRQDLLALPKAGRMRAYMAALTNLGGQGRYASLRGLDTALCEGWNGPKRFPFAQKIQAVLEKNGVRFHRES